MKRVLIADRIDVEHVLFCTARLIQMFISYLSETMVICLGCQTIVTKKQAHGAQSKQTMAVNKRKGVQMLLGQRIFHLYQQKPELSDISAPWSY